MFSERARGLLPALAYLAAFVAAIELGRVSVLEDSQLAAFWPAAGVAALWMLRGRNWPELLFDAWLLFGSATLVNMLDGVSAGSALSFGAANLVQGAAVRWCIAYLNRRPFAGVLPRRLVSLRDLLNLGAASVIAAVLSSPFGFLASQLSDGQWSAWTELTWVVRNSCGTLVIAAAAMALMSAWRGEPDASGRRLALTSERRPGAAGELLVVLAATLMIGISVFTADTPIAFVLIVTSVWVGLRFTPVVGTLHALALGLLAVVTTQFGLGPFGNFTDPTMRAVVVQLFVGLQAMVVLSLALGVADRGRLLRRLVASEARATSRAQVLHAVTSTMNEGLAVLDSHRRILISNPAIRVHTGIPATAGTVPFPDELGIRMLDGSPLPEGSRPVARALNGETVGPEDLLRIDPETGAQRILEFSAAPLHVADREEPLAVVVVRDVTEDRTQKRELEAFAGVVAHDLKSPLTGVKSWSELLGEQLDEIDADLRAGRTPTLRTAYFSLHHIDESADRMHRLIDDLLTYTLSQSAELRLRAVHLDPLVDEIATSLRESNPRAQLDVQHGELGWVHADRMLVRQVVFNLLSNAAKYVARGTSPCIRIATEPIGDQLEIRVSDNGIGIPVSERQRVFGSFYRVGGRSEYAGTGLGLAICARAVERHGGRIAVRDGPDGTGTTVVLTLPVEPGEPEEPDPASGLLTQAAGTRTS